MRRDDIPMSWRSTLGTMATWEKEEEEKKEEEEEEEEEVDE